MKLKYYRHATFLMTIHDRKFLVDPMYMKKGQIPPIPFTLNFHRNPLQNFPGEYPVIEEKDVVLITHHHFDHFDKIAAKKLCKRSLVISPANGFKRLQRMGFVNILPMCPGQNVEIKSFKIHAVPVKHSQRLEKLLYKPGIGYLIEFAKGNIYISGDTVLFNDLADFLKKYSVDLAIFYGGAARIPLLGRHTLSGEEILSLINDIQPRSSVILHLNGLNHCTEDRQDVKASVDSVNITSEVILPLSGEEHIFDSL